MERVRRPCVASTSLPRSPASSRSRRIGEDCGEIEDAFESLEGQRVVISGRLMFLRRQGALTFAQIQDESGRIQAALQRDALPAEARTRTPSCTTSSRSITPAVESVAKCSLSSRSINSGWPVRKSESP